MGTFSCFNLFNILPYLKFNDCSHVFVCRRVNGAFHSCCSSQFEASHHISHIVFPHNFSLPIPELFFPLPPFLRKRFRGFPPCQGLFRPILIVAIKLLKSRFVFRQFEPRRLRSRVDMDVRHGSGLEFQIESPSSQKGDDWAKTSVVAPQGDLTFGAPLDQLTVP
jgi:hypothetical protein